MTSNQAPKSLLLFLLPALKSWLSPVLEVGEQCSQSFDSRPHCENKVRPSFFFCYPIESINIAATQYVIASLVPWLLSDANLQRNLSARPCDWHQDPQVQTRKTSPDIDHPYSFEQHIKTTFHTAPAITMVQSSLIHAAFLVVTLLFAVLCNPRYAVAQTPVCPPPPPATPSNGVLDLSGIGSSNTLATSSSFLSGVSDLSGFTLELYVNFNGINSLHERNIFTYFAPGHYNVIHVWQDRFNRLQINVPGLSQSMSFGLGMDRWYRIALTWDNAEGATALYVNQVLRWETRQGHGKGHELVTGGTLYIGHEVPNGPHDWRKVIDGKIDDVKLWSKALPSGMLTSKADTGPPDLVHLTFESFVPDSPQNGERTVENIVSPGTDDLVLPNFNLGIFECDTNSPPYAPPSSSCSSSCLEFERCDIQAGACLAGCSEDEDPCGNGGRCMVDDHQAQKAVCDCYRHWSGTYCDSPTSCSYNSVLNLVGQSATTTIMDTDFLRGHAKLTAFTVELRVYFDGASGQHERNIFAYYPVGHYDIIYIWQDRFNRLQISVPGLVQSMSFGLGMNRWYRIALTWDNTEGATALYVDRVLRWEARSGYGKNHELATGATLSLGHEVPNGNFQAGKALDGLLDEVKLWSYALIPGQLTSAGDTGVPDLALYTFENTVVGEYPWEVVVVDDVGDNDLLIGTWSTAAITCSSDGEPVATHFSPPMTCPAPCTLFQRCDTSVGNCVAGCDSNICGNGGRCMVKSGETEATCDCLLHWSGTHCNDMPSCDNTVMDLRGLAALTTAGSDSFLAGVPKLTAFTVELWVYLTGNEHERNLFDYHVSHHYDKIRIRLDRWHYVYVNLPGIDQRVNFKLNRDRWYYIAATWSNVNGEAALFVNDEKKWSVASSAGKGWEVGTGGSLHMGYESSWKAFDGFIDNIKLWSKVLPDQTLTSGRDTGLPDVALISFEHAVPGSEPYEVIIKDDVGTNDLLIAPLSSAAVLCDSTSGTTKPYKLRMCNPACSPLQKCDIITGLCFASCDGNPCINGGSCQLQGPEATCLCPEGWTGSLCDVRPPCPNAVLTLDAVATSYATDGSFLPEQTDFDAFTIELWLRCNDVTRQNYVFSYSASGQPDMLTLYIDGHFKVNIHTLTFGGTPIEGKTLSDDHWYHVAVAWESATGSLAIYVDHELWWELSSGVRTGWTIPAGGYLVIGQDQDNHGTGFDAAQAMSGDIDNLKIWRTRLDDAILTSGEDTGVPDLAFYSFDVSEPGQQAGDITIKPQVGDQDLVIAASSTAEIGCEYFSTPPHRQVLCNPQCGLHETCNESSGSCEATCDDGPCDNGGTCSIVDSSVRCSCAEGFVGLRCATAVPGCTWRVLNLRQQAAEPYCADLDFLNGVPELSALTVEAWAYFEDEGRHTILSYNVELSSGVMLELTADTDIDTLQGQIAGESFSEVSSSGSTIESGRWHYFVLVWDGTQGTVTLYADYHKWASIQSSNLQGKLQTGGALVLGQHQLEYDGNFDSASALNGAIDNVIFWDGLVSEAAILKTQIPGVSKLASYSFDKHTTPTDGNQGLTVEDITGNENTLSLPVNAETALECDKVPAWHPSEATAGGCTSACGAAAVCQAGTCVPNCNPQCQNGGTCSVEKDQTGADVAKCQCPSGYEGDSCDIQKQKTTGDTVPIAPVTGGASAGASLIIILIGFCCYKRRKRRHNKGDDHAVVELTTFLRAISVNSRQDSIKLPDSSFQIDRNQLSMSALIGEGAFGEVRTGSYKNQQVAIKTLKPDADEKDREDFTMECMTMEQVQSVAGSHPNVLQMIGYDLSTVPWLLVTEYLARGNLLDLLRRADPTYTSANANTSLSLSQQIKMLLDCSNGLKYLERQKVVHRDVAARNILVDRDMTCKVADFGLARDTYGKDMYEKKSRSRVPFKWMAIESLLNMVYTTASDVWSFGVLMWEVFSYGQVPYRTVSNPELASFLKSGKRLKQPDACPNEIYAVMLQCWQSDPSNRPTFSKLVLILQDISNRISTEENDDSETAIENLTQYVDFGANHLTYAPPLVGTAEESTTANAATALPSANNTAVSASYEPPATEADADGEYSSSASRRSTNQAAQVAPIEAEEALQSPTFGRVSDGSFSGFEDLASDDVVLDLDAPLATSTQPLLSHANPNDYASADDIIKHTPPSSDAEAQPPARRESDTFGFGDAAFLLPGTAEEAEDGSTSTSSSVSDEEALLSTSIGAADDADDDTEQRDSDGGYLVVQENP